MVTEHGFSSLGSLNRSALVGQSDRIAEKVETEAQKLLDDALCEAERILEENRDFVEAVVAELLAKEDLRLPDLQRIWFA